MPLLYLPLRAAEAPPAGQADQVEGAAPQEPVGLPEREAAAGEEDSAPAADADDAADAESSAASPAAREPAPREREPGERLSLDNNLSFPVDI